MVPEPWEEQIAVAELRHEARRKRSSRAYRMVERVFFAALVFLAVLILLKFGSAVLPEYF